MTNQKNKNHIKAKKSKESDGKNKKRLSQKKEEKWGKNITKQKKKKKLTWPG